ncbi:MAG: ParA family protein [Hyphomicrobiaceae bacterium]|nr:ParA family protein [Hyphomicrobiaceae bacterium]
MRKTVAVMNTKGGVGKSTLVLGLAETLSVFHAKNVLVIDSDAQASVSSMLLSVQALHKLQTESSTLVDYLVATVLRGTPVNWVDYVVRDVSDVDEANSVYLTPSDMQLTLFEREVSKESLHGHLRKSIRNLLSEVRAVFDVVLIDCPPGLSVLTESWLREADFHLSPTKPDYVSLCGLEVFRRFKALNPEMGFAENLGVVVNMKDPHSATDADYEIWLKQQPENHCFTEALPYLRVMQDAARYKSERSYMAKYPGEAGRALRSVADELVERLSQGNEASAAPPARKSSLPT